MTKTIVNTITIIFLALMMGFQSAAPAYAHPEPKGHHGHHHGDKHHKGKHHHHRHHHAGKHHHGHYHGHGHPKRHAHRHRFKRGDVIHVYYHPRALHHAHRHRLPPLPKGHRYVVVDGEVVEVVAKTMIVVAAVGILADIAS